MGEGGFRELLDEQDARALIAANPTDEPRCSARYAFERAKLLLGCYPRNQADDPDTYATAVAAVLGDYPERVVKRVTDPRIGVARSVKFLPSIAEISDVCEREAKKGGDVRRMAERHLKARLQPRYREALEDMLGHPVGRATFSDDADKAERAARIIKAGVKGVDPRLVDAAPASPEGRKAG
ncbi:hypothetical protein [Hansschlegelia sp.]|uniref:hypothetical protein n=1 Tax=Hansschlegelia sp. TaxID=2041892 RepID=UPI002BD33174|nr:hypothetical protein [Hansschlegelia sp.]HVI27512.1 hypothetical protein [Hansschlegelia sp.]